MSGPAALIAGLSRRPVASRLDPWFRALSPRAWRRTVDTFAELLAGGMVVPSPGPTDDGPEPPVWSVVQLDGDIQLKVRSDLDGEALALALRDHHAAMEQARERIAEGFRQVRAGQALLITLPPAVAAAKTLVDAARHGEMAGLVAALDLWPLGLAAALATLGLLLPRVVGVWARRRLRRLVRRQDAADRGAG